MPFEIVAEVHHRIIVGPISYYMKYALFCRCFLIDFSASTCLEMSNCIGYIAKISPSDMIKKQMASADIMVGSCTLLFNSKR